MISNQIKSIQNWNAIILNISPTCLNWKKGGSIVDSDLELYAKHLKNLSENFEGTLWEPLETEDVCAGLDCYTIWWCAKCRH